jgi:hypothetical protein
MTTDTLFDALEVCLQALDQGADVESCLVRYPALADELRPILIAAVQARAASVMEVPADVAQRGKARVLQAAAEMRDQQVAVPARSFWRQKGFFGARFFRLAVTTTLVIAFLLTGGTGLVNASSGALPGDRLYPVKRSWEGVQLAFVFDQQTKTELEHRFDHERLQEIEELYSEKRIEQVNFQGVVETQQTGVWRIEGLDVAIDEETTASAGINSGAIVRIVGETDDGVIKAGRIILVATPGITPTTISTTTPAPQILPTIAPEETRTLEDGQGSGDESEIIIEGTKTPDAPGNPINGIPTWTPRSRHEDSGSTDGSGGGNEPSSTDDHHDDDNHNDDHHDDYHDGTGN